MAVGIIQCWSIMHTVAVLDRGGDFEGELCFKGILAENLMNFKENLKGLLKAI